MRGPAILPARLGTPAVKTRRQRFDDVVIGVVAGLEERWADRLGLVEYAVEDAPLIPDDWSTGTVPLSSLVRGSGATPTRIVVFRRPIEHRAESFADLESMVHAVVVDQVAELLGLTPEQVDPRYESDES